jgi:hypothetical protein
LSRYGLIGRLLRDALADSMRRLPPLVWIVLSLGAWTVWALGAIAVARTLGFRWASPMRSRIDDRRQRCDFATSASIL